MKRKHIKLDLEKQSTLKLIALADKLLLAQLMNQEYFREGTDALENLEEASESNKSVLKFRPDFPGKEYKDLVIQLREILIKRIKQLVLFVTYVLLENKPEESEKIIMLAGLEPKKVGEKVLPFTSVKNGKEQGSVIFRCKPAIGFAYLIKVYYTDEAGTTPATIITSTHCINIIKGLKRETKYWFSVTYVKGQQQSEASEPVCIIVN